jgi:hypothetical protein
VNSFCKFAASLCVLATLAVPAFAQGNSQGHGNGKNKHADNDVVQDSHASSSSVFSRSEREIITKYFHGGYSNLPPGLAKRNSDLPPGLQKQLAKNGTLPPGLQKRLTPFPPDLERRLPPLPDIYRRGSIGSSVVLIDRKTQRILDIIDAVIRP